MTAPAVTAPVQNTDGSLANVDLTFLDSVNAEYEKRKTAWERDEKRLAGGDEILDELVQFDGESAEGYAARKKSASYVNFLKTHNTTVTGRLRTHAPTVNWGHLGDVRTRAEIDTPTFAELVKYNINGVGNDGMEFESFMDEVDVRAQATNWRWLFWEGAERDGALGPPSEAEVRAGARPYVVEWSPLSVPNWFLRNGQLQFAIVRVETAEPFTDGAATDADLGYYLLVRKGYRGLGEAFAGGGWWLFDSKKALLGSKEWGWAQGDIPLWRHMGDSIMELGQIAVALMNAISMRDWDANDAAASRLYFLNADGKVMKVVAGQVATRNVMIGVPPAESTTGDASTEHTIQIYDGSAGAVASGVFKEIIESKYREAQEQSILQVSSIASSSGESKEVGDRGVKSPFLARRAAQRAQSDNTLIHFAEKRFGFPNPKGFAEWTDDFDLQPLIDDLEAAYDVLRRSRLKSATLEQDLLLQIMDERGTMDPEKRKKIEAELAASAAQADALADMDRRLLGGGSPTLTLEGTDDDATNAANRGGGTSTPAAEARGGADPEGAATDGGDAARGAGEPAVTEPLNGAQITAAKDVMLSLRAAVPSERLSPEAALELLVLVGVPRANATSMVGAQTEGIEAAADVTEVDDAEAAGTKPKGQAADDDEEGDKTKPLAAAAAPSFDSPMLRIIQSMKDVNPQYRISPETAVALLVEAGVDPDIAETIVAAERANIPPLEPRPDRDAIVGIPPTDMKALIAEEVRKAMADRPPAPSLSVIQIPGQQQQRGAVRFTYTGANGVPREIIATPITPSDNGTSPE